MSAGKTGEPQNDGAPKLSYWHLWADDDGISRQTRCTLTAFENASIGPGDSPQWNNGLVDDANAFLTVLPVGWSSGWHINHEPKWIFTLSGAWYVESMDGQRVVLGPGEFAYGGDQNCVADPEGRLGHLSGQFGDEPCVQLIVQRNDDAWVALRPGAFK
jgi:hypothetical protein